MSCDTLITNDPHPGSVPQSGIGRLFRRFGGGVLVRFLDGHYVDRTACDTVFLRMHQRDSIGDRLHLFFACLGLVGLFGPMTLSGVAFAPLVVFFLVRVFNTFPVWIHGFGQPVGLLAIAISGWMMLSLRWSGDVMLGWGEIAELRWFVLVGLIFPVIERRAVLIGAMCIGVAFGQIGQVFDFFDGFGIDWLADLVAHEPRRISGWWEPVVGGSILVAGFGLHLPAAVFGSGKARMFGLLGSISVGIGIIATGTRGAWIAGVLLILCVLGFGMMTKRVRTKRVLIVMIGLVIVSGVAGMMMRKAISSRVAETRTELAEIFDGEYDSMTGRRVQMAQLAAQAGIEHPIVGVGAGGYQTWANEQEPKASIHAHAHNSFLQIWSTLGAVGVLLWGLMIAALFRSAWALARLEDSHVYAMGPMFAIAGFLLVSLTDSVQINTQTAAMLGALAAMCPAYRPGHGRWGLDRGDK